MDFNASTKIGDLMKQYPFLKDELLKMDDRFKILDNPLMKTVIGSATLQTVSEKTGLSLEDITGKLKSLIEARG